MTDNTVFIEAESSLPLLKNERVPSYRQSPCGPAVFVRMVFRWRRGEASASVVLGRRPLLVLTTSIYCGRKTYANLWITERLFVLIIVCERDAFKTERFGDGLAFCG